METDFRMWIIVIAYLVFICVIGSYINRKNKSKDMSDYFLSGRSLPPIVIAFTIVGTTQSGMVFLGAPGTGYTVGYPQMISTCMIGGVLGIILCNLVLGKPMRLLGEKIKAVTLPDLLTSLYKSEKVRNVAIPTILIASVFYIVVQWSSCGNLFLALLGVDYKIGVLLGVVVIILFVAFGGNRSTALVGTFQIGLAMFACLYITFLALHAGGGLTSINENLAKIDPNMIHMVNDSFPLIRTVSFVLLYAVGMLGQPSISTKFFQIKTSRLLPIAMCLGVFSYICTITNPLASYVMRINIEGGVFPALTSTDTVIPMFIKYFANPYIGGLLIAACLAAIMTTAAALILTVSSTITNDICKGWFHMNLTDKQGIRYSRIAVVFVTIGTGLIALWPLDTIFWLGNAAWGAFAAVFTPALVFGLRWRRSTKQGAFSSMLVALAMVLFLRILDYSGIWPWPFQMDLSVVTLIVATAVFVVVSLLTPKQENELLPPSRRELKQRAAAKAAAQAEAKA